jgi:hypothetical protein
MVKLPRLLPSPLPPVRYVPEYRAEGPLKDAYEDMKSVLQVPWMGVVTMAYANFPHFFEVFWSGMRELCGSVEFVAAANELRDSIERAVEAMEPPPIAARLRDRGYSERELDDIRAVPEMLSHGNYLYTLMTTAARLLLEGGELGPVSSVVPFTGRHGPPPRVPLILMEAHHVDAATGAVFDDVKRRLRLPFLNTDYRALARWPSYFAMAWADLGSRIGGAEHEAACEVYQARAVELLAGLPNPSGLTGAALRAAAERDGSPDLLPVVQLFQHLHAGLMTNVAYFRNQLLYSWRGA